MGKTDFVNGTSTIEQFFKWINDRHYIYCERAAGKPKPWTDDPIFLDWKFTNVFRQLDTGTVVLHDYIVKGWEAKYGDRRTFLWNIIWYRLFNYWEHAKNVGFVVERQSLYDYLRLRWKQGKKVFTSCHMYPGESCRNKVETYIDACETAWEQTPKILIALNKNTMESVFNEILLIKWIGPFLAYEITCDIRFTKLFNKTPLDVLTWTNIGGGAKRGLKRLGLSCSILSMRSLLKISEIHLDKHVINHLLDNGVYPPFELREVEHSLCEFDKYERIRTGQGRPRQKYNGR